MIKANESTVIQLKEHRLKLSQQIASSTLYTINKIKNIDVDCTTQDADECCEDIKIIKSRIDENRKSVLKRHSN